MRSFAAFRISGICAALLSLVASTEASAEPRKPTHIACVGDSITYGANSSDPATKAYPVVLQGLEGNGVVVKNFGRSGATMLSNGDVPFINLTKPGDSAYSDATSFVDNAGANAVVSVIIILGANDSKDFNWNRNATNQGQQYLKDYLAMVDHFAGLQTK